MKKTFWGYDVREADEVIDSLRSQNSILSSKLTKLNMELAAKSEMETPAPAAAVPEDHAPRAGGAAGGQRGADRAGGQTAGRSAEAARQNRRIGAGKGIRALRHQRGADLRRAYENVEKIRAELIEEMQERIPGIRRGPYRGGRAAARLFRADGGR